MAELVFSHHPDPQRRADKARWRQRTEVLRSAITDAVARGGFPAPRIALVSETFTSPEQLRPEPGWWVRCCDTLPGPSVAINSSALDESGPVHVLALELDAPRPGQRMQLIGDACALLRPGGCLLVLTDVVALPGSGLVPPRMSQLIEEIQQSTGGLVHLEDITSIAWVQEPWRRGVLLALSTLQLTGRGQA